MGASLVDVACASMDRYKGVLEETILRTSMDYEKKDRQIPILRIREHAISMHAGKDRNPDIIGVSVNVHEPAFCLDEFARRLAVHYGEMEGETVGQFFAEHAIGYQLNMGITTTKDALELMLKPGIPYIAVSATQRKAGIVRMDFSVLPKGKTLMNRKRELFTELVYGHVLRSFFGEYVEYIRMLQSRAPVSR